MWKYLKIFNETFWQQKLQAEFAVRGEAHGSNKLRTCRTFKNKFRSAYAKFKCGV